MIQPNPHLASISRIPERLNDGERLIRLDRNERVNAFPPALFQEMLSALTPESVSRYPDTGPLSDRLSRQLGLPGDWIYPTPGSDAAIRMLFQAFLRPEDWVLLADPSYAMYAIYARVFQASVERVSYGPSLKLDLEGVLGRLESKPRILALAVPDQPTGALLAPDHVQALAKATQRTGTLLIIDEAYFPFSKQTALPLIHSFDHLAVVRSFSKAAGLAGLRLGFLAAQPPIVEAVAKIRGAHEVNAAALAFGRYVLDHPEVIDEQVALVEEGRRILIDAARRLGVQCPSCPANFQLLRFPGMNGTQEMLPRLREKGYLVKGDFSAAAVRDCIRVTITDAETMRRFGASLEQTLAEMKWRAS